MTFHKDLGVGDNHIPHNWEYADAAARTGATGFVTADLNKWALQLDDLSFWRLSATTPTWVQVTGAGGGPHVIASHSDTTATGAELETLTNGSDADALHAHAVTDTHVANTANPHATDIENLGAGTLAELNAAVSDATLDDASGSRTPSAHTVASHSDTTATGAELDTLTDGSNADALHSHAGGSGDLLADGTVPMTADFDLAANSLKFADKAAPVNPGAGLGLMYKKTGDDGVFWKPDAAGAEVDLTDQVPQAHTVASHSDTTATGAELETLTNGADADALHAHAVTDTHVANTANPHATDIGNLGAGTLAELNAAVSDATLDDAGDARTPSAHTVASHSDTTATGAELETLTDGSNADSLHSHAGVGAHLVGSVTHTADTLANFNTKISDATLDDASDSRTPSAHTITSHSDTTATGAELETLTDGSNADALHSHAGVGAHLVGSVTHTADTLANFNTKISDATLDDASASRTPSAHTVASHSDTTATGAELETLTNGSDADALHAHAVTDTHVANTANPHATDIENLGAGTLAELNAAISDATLDDASASRTPSAHTVASHSDTTATGAELETLTNGSDADALHAHAVTDAHVANTANPHATDIENLGSGTMAELNAAITDGTLDTTSDTRTPAAHTIASHSDTTGTGSQLNTLVGGGDADSLHAHATNDAKVSNATHTGDVTGSVALTIAALAVDNGMLSATAVTVGKIDDEGAADGEVMTSDGVGGVAWEAPAGGAPTGTAGGSLNGTYPNPSVDDGADGTAIHDDTSGEINAITAKANPVLADILLLEDTGASNAKKKITIEELNAVTQYATDVAQTVSSATPKMRTFVTTGRIAGANITDTTTSRFTIDDAGRYRISHTELWRQTTGPARVVTRAELYINGTGQGDFAAGITHQSTAAGYEMTAGFTRIYDLAATDYVEIEVFISVGGTAVMTSQGGHILFERIG